MIVLPQSGQNELHRMSLQRWQELCPPTFIGTHGAPPFLLKYSQDEPSAVARTLSSRFHWDTRSTTILIKVKQAHEIDRYHAGVGGRSKTLGEQWLRSLQSWQGGECLLIGNMIGNFDKYIFELMERFYGHDPLVNPPSSMVDSSNNAHTCD